MWPEHERRPLGNGCSGIGALFPELEMKRARDLVTQPHIG